MTRRKGMTDAGVAALKPRAARYSVPDPETRGLYIRVTPKGSKSFVAVSLDPRGKQKWVTLGSADAITIEEAREKARTAIARVRGSGNDSFKAISEQWVERHVKGKGLRSAPEIERCLSRYVLPDWERRPFTGIKRSDIAALLDRIEDNHGARQADLVLAIVRGISNWFAKRNDDYLSPFVKGMRRAATTKRDRVLDEEELRAIWQAADGIFGDFIKLSLLTAQRREKVVSMRWDDVSVDGVWTIPSAPREKGHAGKLRLPDMALEIIRARPRVGDNPFVLPGSALGHFNGFSTSKPALDAKLPDMPGWTLHDLRRSARSYMSAAGVRPDVAERILGHAILGVEGVYDRHQYEAEKADALSRLAAHINSIISPPPANVVPLKQAAQ